MEKLEWIRERFASKTIPPEDLLLQVEPVLVDALPLAPGSVRALVNKIERIVFTEVEPRRSRLLLDVLDEAIRLVEEGNLL